MKINKILFFVTSDDALGNAGKKTGFMDSRIRCSLL